MIEDRCIRCGQLIVAPTRAKFQQRYTQHVVDEHDKPATTREVARQ